MEIALKEVTVGELTEGYRDDGDAGVVGYGGRLDIRPPFQREFVYDERQRVAVIDTVMAGYPLNVMYWADRGDGSFEVIDGQQRTLSLCQYVHGDFAHMMRYFHNLKEDEQEKVLDAKTLEARVAKLMMDSDVTKKSGIYAYVLDGDERHLSLRAFDDNTKREVYEIQGGRCPICEKAFPLEEMEADHITPWSQGGHTLAENCQLLCRECNRRKSDR